MQSHTIDYEIFGNEMQFVEITLDPGETAVAEAGALMCMEQGIQMQTKMTDGSQQSKGLLKGFLAGAKRSMAGESFFMTFFSNNGNKQHKVSFTAPYPGVIIPLDLSQNQGSIICQKDAFLCGALGVSIGMGFQKRISSGLFGGEGFIMQKLTGDGLVFIHAGGCIVEKTLAAGEKLYVDTGSVVAYQPSVNYDIRPVSGVKSAMFGGEGFFISTLEGPGKIWVQSFPFPRFLTGIEAEMAKKFARIKKKWWQK